MKNAKLAILIIILSANTAYACNGTAEQIINEKSENGKFSVCVTASATGENYTIDLIEHKGSAEHRVSRNDSLFRRDEQLEATLDNNGNLSLVSIMAKDSYQLGVLLTSEGAYLTEACHQIENDSPVPDIEVVSQVVLCREYPFQAQTFSSAKTELVFDSRELFFKKSQSSTRLFISSEKAFLFSAPQESALTKMYLIQGDPVEVLDSKKQWVLIRYINSKAKTIEKWINASALL